MRKEQQVTKEPSRSLYDSCPLILSTRLAHQGHQGAAIALLQARAVWKRVKILWSHDNEFFGDEDPGLQMWREIIISI
jgi:hypothetical protein